MNSSILIKNTLENIASFGTTPKGMAQYIDIGTGKYLKYLEKEVIDEYICKGGSTCKFFEGAYGSGKTHILQMLQELAFNKNMAVIYTNLTQELNLSDWKNITIHILQNIEVKIGGEIVKSLPRILMTIGKNLPNDKIEPLCKLKLPSSGFRNAMVYAMRMYNYSIDARFKLEKFLLGEKISSKELEIFGFSKIKGCLSQKNAEYVLKTVLEFLYQVGFAGTMLLFDENENTFYTHRREPSKKDKIAANLLRRMIDSCFNGNLIGTLIVFAVLPGFLENCSLNYPALGERLQISNYDKASWRWQLISVELLNSIRNHEEFLEKAILVFEKNIKILKGNVTGIKDKMWRQGMMVIERNAGSGYKRELMKVLAGIALDYLEG